MPLGTAIHGWSPPSALRHGCLIKQRKQDAGGRFGKSERCLWRIARLAKRTPVDARLRTAWMRSRCGDFCAVEHVINRPRLISPFRLYLDSFTAGLTKAVKRAQTQAFGTKAVPDTFLTHLWSVQLESARPRAKSSVIHVYRGFDLQLLP